MISDLTVISQIELPGQSEDREASSNDDAVLLGISIQADGRYAINRMADEETLYADIQAEEELEFVLKSLKDQHQSAGSSLSIYIEPAAEAPMQSLVDALDVCERLNLPKNINTQAVVAALNV